MLSAPKYVLNASRVLQHLGEANLTQKEAAEGSGFNAAHFHKLIAGHYSPTAKSRRRLMASEVFRGLSFSDLFEQVQAGGGAP